MKQILISLSAIFLLTHCSQNASLLGDTADVLKGATTATATTSSTSSGTLWVVGGTTGAISGATGTVLSYSPSTNAWTAQTTTGTYTPVSFAAYAAYGKKIYVFGGFSAAGVAQNTVQILNTETLAWSAGPTLSAAMAQGTAVVVGSKIVVMGGSTANANVAWTVSAINNLLDTTNDTIATQTPLSGTTGQGSNQCAVGDGTAVLHSVARTAAVTITGTTQPFLLDAAASPTTPKTTTLGTGFTNRAGAACVLYSPGGTGNANFFITIGGLTANTGNTGAFVAGATAGGLGTLTAWTSVNTVQALPAPYFTTWATSTALPVATSFAGAAILSNVLYVVGGNTGTAAAQNLQVTDAVYAASLTANGASAPALTWSTNVPGTTTALTALPAARWGHGLLVIQ